MKICLFTDVHWCSYSSIVRKRTPTFSMRLENLIASMNWVEATASLHDCERVYCLGDFFDQESLNSEEISALSKIKWSSIPHYFIVGNHELGRNDLYFSSTSLFKLANSYIIDNIEDEFIDNTRMIYLPYVLEDNRKELGEYFNHSIEASKTILLSHNDIKGIQLGPIISQSGFEIEDIENHCDICFNGHLHNGEKISNKIINLGNLTGQNFSEDATKYKHRIIILDTDTLEYEFIENPYAFNFYKLDLSNSLDSDIDIELGMLKDNAVTTIKCSNKNYEHIVERVNEHANIVEHRFIVYSNELMDSISSKEITNVDHLAQFYNYITSNEGHDTLILEELDEVLK